MNYLHAVTKNAHKVENNKKTINSEFKFMKSYFNTYNNNWKYKMYPLNGKKKTDQENILKQNLMDCFDGKIFKILELEVFQVYQNFKTQKRSLKNSEYIFHGTNINGISGILQYGCKNSNKGWYGRGFYMTHLVDAAIYYSNRKSKNDDYNYIIVVDVINTTKEKKFIFDENTKQINKRTYEQFEYKQITHKSSAIHKNSKKIQ